MRILSLPVNLFQLFILSTNAVLMLDDFQKSSVELLKNVIWMWKTYASIENMH